MGVGDKLNTELAAWGFLAITLIVFMIVLGNIKSTNKGSFVCNSGQGLNATSNKCCHLFTNNALECNGVNETAILTQGTTIDDFITGLSEPKNWVSIFVIALIGFGIIKYVRSKEE